jgi:hypothetical protein
MESIMKRQYPALGIIATIYKISGVFVLVGAIFAFIFALFSSSIVPNSRYSTIDASIGVVTIMTGLLALVVGFLTAVGLYGFGELLDLMRDIELNTRSAADDAELTARNTRNTVQLLYQLVQNQQSRGTERLEETNTWKTQA